MSTGGDAHEIRFIVGPAGDTNGRRLVCAYLGDQEIERDEVVFSRSAGRREFLARVAERAGVARSAELQAGLDQQLRAAADEVDAATVAEVADGAASRQGRRASSQASLLVELTDRFTFFRSPDDVAYVSLALDGHQETWLVRSKLLKQYMARQFHLTHGSVPGSQAMQDALTTLEGRALIDGATEEVHVRFAQRGGSIYLDLADRTWSVVRIDPTGWQVDQNPPVKFRRTGGMLPLPTPVAGGRLDDLRQFINVSADDEALLFAWLVGAARPHGPFPVLALNGEQGTAKSTTSKVLRRLLDPNKADLRRASRTARFDDRRQ